MKKPRDVWSQGKTRRSGFRGNAMPAIKLQDVCVGSKFGKWTVIGQEFVKSGTYYALCRCECGEKREIRCSCLRRGTSSGCNACSSTTHGGSNHPLHSVWCAMRSRCENPENAGYDRYGGRGIDVCPEWSESWERFFAWAKDSGYLTGLEIDRIDNDKGYSPDNCRWVTRIQNNRNTRQNRNVTALGKTQCLAAWAEELGVSFQCIQHRLNRGWSDEDAVTNPGAPRERLIEFDGQVKTLAEWSRDTGIKYTTIKERLKRGWSPEQALSEPVSQSRLSRR